MFHDPENSVEENSNIGRKLQYREKAFEEFKRFFLFPRKMIL